MQSYPRIRYVLISQVRKCLRGIRRFQVTTTQTSCIMQLTPPPPPSPTFTSGSSAD